MSLGEQLRKKAIEILSKRPQGIRYGDLLKEVQNAFPKAKWNTLEWALWDLDVTSNGAVVKPQRGLLIMSKFLPKHEDSLSLKVQNLENSVNVAEQEKDESLFYEPFASYLQADLNECSMAKSYGGNKLDRKWMTPDVVGYYKVKTTASFPKIPEIVTAEIKITQDYQNAITGFGQASSYLLYSHKSYLVIPKEVSIEDRRIIESLCTTFGIGLVIYNSKSHEKPEFELRNKAQRREPDVFYLNKYGTKIVEFIEEG